MSITTIARHAQGMRAREVITKLAEDAYFMRVDNRVTQVPPLRTHEADHEATSRSPADNGRTTQVHPTNLLEGLKQRSLVRSSTTRAPSLKDRMATREGGSEYEPVKILLKEPGLYPRQISVTHERWIESHTNRQDNEVMDQPQVLGTIP
jgi:hypothetical protein